MVDVRRGSLLVFLRAPSQFLSYLSAILSGLDPCATLLPQEEPVAFSTENIKLPSTASSKTSFPKGKRRALGEVSMNHQ